MIFMRLYFVIAYILLIYLHIIGICLQNLWRLIIWLHNIRTTLLIFILSGVIKIKVIYQLLLAMYSRMSYGLFDIFLGFARIVFGLDVSFLLLLILRFWIVLNFFWTLWIVTYRFILLRRHTLWFWLAFVMPLLLLDWFVLFKYSWLIWIFIFCMYTIIFLIRSIWWSIFSINMLRHWWDND